MVSRRTFLKMSLVSAVAAVLGQPAVENVVKAVRALPNVDPSGALYKYGKTGTVINLKTRILEVVLLPGEVTSMVLKNLGPATMYVQVCRVANAGSVNIEVCDDVIPILKGRNVRLVFCDPQWRYVVYAWSDRTSTYALSVVEVET